MDIEKVRICIQDITMYNDAIAEQTEHHEKMLKTINYSRNKVFEELRYLCSTNDLYFEGSCEYNRKHEDCIIQRCPILKHVSHPKEN